MWKLCKFSDSQILREISSVKSKVSKMPILTILGALNFAFERVLEFPHCVVLGKERTAPYLAIY